jgi:hypothetical protein
MARLMSVPIRKRGDAVLILSRDAANETELIGFVAASTPSGFFEHKPSMCECISLVEQNLPAIEKFLLAKSGPSRNTDGSTACVEVTAFDLAAIDLTHT